ncbi:MAG: cell division protein ZapA [Rubellimicrobium sp.]|nr:cell division protein ZapA [Rubellimicrobium sp.]
MPQVEVTIGGRSFEVACQSGEEPYLRTAAALLDSEAAALSAQIGRMPEARMLLMAGLMLADKAAGLEDRLIEAERRLTEMARMVAEMESAPPTVIRETVEVRVEVPVERVVERSGPAAIPEAHLVRLAELAADAEALAQEAERR